MTLSNNPENNVTLNIYHRVHLVCMKVQAQRSLELQLEYSEAPIPLTNET